MNISGYDYTTPNYGMIIGMVLALIVVIIGVISGVIFIRKIMCVHRRRGMVHTCKCQEMIEMTRYV